MAAPFLFNTSRGDCRDSLSAPSYAIMLHEAAEEEGGPCVRFPPTLEVSITGCSAVLIDEMAKSL